MSATLRPLKHTRPLGARLAGTLLGSACAVFLVTAILAVNVLQTASLVVRPFSPPAFRAINRWLADYARANGFTFVDYHSAMAQPDGAMKPGLSSDGVHPTKAGYAMMRPLAEAAIARTLGESK